MKNCILNGRPTSIICNITNVLAANPGPLFSIHKGDVETWGLQCTQTVNTSQWSRTHLVSISSTFIIEIFSHSENFNEENKRDVKNFDVLSFVYFLQDNHVRHKLDFFIFFSSQNFSFFFFSRKSMKSI